VIEGEGLPWQRKGVYKLIDKCVSIDYTIKNPSRRYSMKKIMAFLLLALLVLPSVVLALDEETKAEIENLKKQVEELKMAQEKGSWPTWLKITGDLRTRYDYLKGTIHDHYLLIPASALGLSYSSQVPVFVGGTPYNSIKEYDAKNESLLTNRFRLGLVVNPVEDVYATARLAMYKVWGHQTEGAVQGAYFADRAQGTFDGSVTHVPEDSLLRVDQADFSIRNILGQPIWFSIGRRPSTGGTPTHYRRNEERVGTGGVQGILVDYAFDGLTLGYAPEIGSLPGAYAKVCYGKGFDSGYKNLQGNDIKDVSMLGIDLVPIDTEPLRVELEFNRAYNIFDNMPDSGVRTNLGDIEQYGTSISGKVGSLNLFASAGMSKTKPNKNMFTFAVDGNGDGDLVDVGIDNPSAGAGLLYDDNPMTPGVDVKDHTGYAYYLGARYDIASTGTKIGAEYNWGSRYWITFTPAADDMWTSKLGTRGSVYEVYLIQSLNRRPVAKRGDVFFRLGYQYYDFKYTGSNSWVGEPKEIDKLSSSDPMTAQMFQPVDKAYDIYLTVEVVF